MTREDLDQRADLVESVISYIEKRGDSVPKDYIYSYMFHTHNMYSSETEHLLREMRIAGLLTANHGYYSLAGKRKRTGRQTRLY